MLRRLYSSNLSLFKRSLQFIALRGLPSHGLSLRARAKRLEYVPTQSFQDSNFSFVRHYSDSTSFPNKAVFEEVCGETLESLTDYFEELVENADHLRGSDVSYSDGVLTIQFGEPYGTYVINRQSPNEQIWLSSPTSGPKRYDYIGGVWVYRHDNVSLHELLNKEISEIVKTKVDFKQCNHSQP